LRFADDLLGARDLRDNLAPPPLDIGCFPLKVQKARTPLETLLDQHGDGCGLVVDDTNAPCCRAFLCL
jgi:hypothetical protein